MRNISSQRKKTISSPFLNIHMLLSILQKKKKKKNRCQNSKSIHFYQIEGRNYLKNNRTQHVLRSEQPMHRLKQQFFRQDY